MERKCYLKKYYNKSCMFMAAALLGLVCGCGGKDAGSDRTEGTDGIVAESIMADGSGEASAAKEAPADHPGEGNERQEEEEIAGKEEGASGGKGEENGGNKETDPENAIIWDDVTGEGIKTVHGNVRSMEEGSFTIAQAMTGIIKGEDADAGIMVSASPGSEGESDLITVTYGEETGLIVRTTTDGGMTSSDRPGEWEELKKESSVIITGSWEGDLFRAEEVVIFISE